MNKQMTTSPDSQPVSDAAALLATITRVATDATVDVNKFQQMLAIYERIDAKRAESAFTNSMVDAQAEMRPVSQDAANPQTRSKYASYAALDNALRPIYTKHGLALSFDTADSPVEGYVRIVCKVAHRDGHSERPHLDLPADGKGAKGGDVMTKTHATMSAVSYGRRGLLKMVFNIAEGEYDDDGNGGGSVNTDCITDAQAAQIEQIHIDNGFDLNVFLKWAKIEKFADLRADKYARVMSALSDKIKAKAGAK